MNRWSPNIMPNAKCHKEMAEKSKLGIDHFEFFLEQTEQVFMIVVRDRVVPNYF